MIENIYELSSINRKIVENFFQVIKKIEKKDKKEEILYCSFMETFSYLLPEFPEENLEVLVRELIKPILNSFTYSVRNYVDESEKYEVYQNTYSNLIDEISRSEKREDQCNLELINYIYDLLDYDKVIIINNEKYLYSYYFLSHFGNFHLKVFHELKKLKIHKPAEVNIDIATNTTRSIDKRIDFLNPLLNLSINNPNKKSKKEELQNLFLENYAQEYRIIARSIYQLSQIKESVNNYEIKAIADLEPYIDSDKEITYKKIYTSWYAYIFNMCQQTDMPVSKKLKLAQLSSYIIFPNLQGKDPIISEKTARKPIREVAFFKGLRLLDFSDNRNKIKKTDEEIEFTENYLSLITEELSKYI